MVLKVGQRAIKITKRSRRRFRIDASLTMRVKHEDGCYIAYCPELKLSSYGSNIDEAEKNLSEVLTIFFEDIIRRGTVDEVLAECGWARVKEKSSDIPKWVPPAYVVNRKIPLSING